MIATSDADGKRDGYNGHAPSGRNGVAGIQGEQHRLRPYVWETGIARQFVGTGEVLDLLDCPGYFGLLGKPVPEGRGAVLESLESDRLISRDVGGKWNVLNLGAILFARDVGAFESALSRKAIRLVVYDGEGRSATVTPFPAKPEALHRQEDRLWIPLRQEWREVAGKPEESVRQHFIRHLCDNYGYALEQMAQERRTTHGHRSPRADVVIWETPKAKSANKTPVLVVECKAENVEIDIRDYYQGESYTRAAGGEFFIAHNARHTAVFRLIPGVPGEFVQINEIPKATDWGDARRLDEIRKRLRAFNRREFQDLLFRCHSILRDVHKMDPGRAFDTISKILFVKMYVERSGLHGTFTADFLDRRATTRLPSDPLVHDDLFDRTKDYYRTDDLFTGADRLEISEETFRRIVKELERFDLSKTGDDIKGLAFEKFLGSTFRGELGQFFTPCPVVDFMVNLLDPQEGELICDFPEVFDRCLTSKS